MARMTDIYEVISSRLVAVSLYAPPIKITCAPQFFHFCVYMDRSSKDTAVIR